MRLFILTVLLGMGAVAMGQTPLIAWKSHAGNIEAFIPALRAGQFDTKNHHLGQAPQRFVDFAVLDTVIYVHADTVIVVTSLVSAVADWFAGCSWQSSLWEPGRDTIVNDTFWNCGDQQHLVKRLNHDYNFANGVASTVFIGFPENSPNAVPTQVDDHQEEYLLPVWFRFPRRPAVPLALAAVLVASLLTGLASRRWQYPIS